LRDIVIYATVKNSQSVFFDSAPFGFKQFFNFFWIFRDFF